MKVKLTDTDNTENCGKFSNLCRCDTRGHARIGIVVQNKRRLKKHNGGRRL